MCGELLLFTIANLTRYKRMPGSCVYLRDAVYFTYQYEDGGPLYFVTDDRPTEPSDSDKLEDKIKVPAIE